MRQARKSRWFIVVIVVLVLLALRFFAPAFSTRAIYAILSPFMRSGLVIRDTSKLSEGVLKSKQTLIDENNQLRTELADAERKYELSGNLQAENDELRKLLDLTKNKSSVAALVLSKPPLSPYDSLVIEFGAGKSVSVGERVYADGNIILGEITEVDGTAATVKLYSTASTEIIATIERNNISQKAVGAGGGNFIIKAPKEVDVVNGDVLIIPGLDKKILGIVRQIDTQPTDSFQNVLVKSPVNIFQLKWVTIEQPMH